jgi:hypothetical protein
MAVPVHGKINAPTMMVTGAIMSRLRNRAAGSHPHALSRYAGLFSIQLLSRKVRLRAPLGRSFGYPK